MITVLKKKRKKKEKRKKGLKIIRKKNHNFSQEKYI
jgi:hypothetical protein